MCGRFACGLAPDVVRRLSTYVNSQTQESTLPPFIDLMSSTQPFRASWNIFPTSSCLCLISAKHLDATEDSATRVLCSMRWSLVPHYHQGSANEFKSTFNNCRSENIDEKRTFKVPLRSGKRCIILAEGFFEWKKNAIQKPYFIYVAGPYIYEKHYPNIDVDDILEKINKKNEGRPTLLAMAGIFDIHQNSEKDPLYSCAICTVDASKTMLSIHPRMPVIFTTQQEIDQWLDFGRFDTEKVLPLLASRNDIQMYPVTSSVGSTRTNTMNNIRPYYSDENSAANVSKHNTLDSFVTKQEATQHLQESTIKTENTEMWKRTSEKRKQRTIEEYMFKNTKSSEKRFKK